MFDLFNLSGIPKSFAETTTRADEVPPRSVGVDPAGVEEIWRSVERFYRTGLQSALQLCPQERSSSFCPTSAVRLQEKRTPETSRATHVP